MLCYFFCRQVSSCQNLLHEEILRLHIKLFESGHEEVDVLVQVSVLYLDLFTIIKIIIARNLLKFEKLSAFYPMP